MSSIQRFYIPADFINNSVVLFPKESIHQIVHVLRLKEGNHVKVFDGSGNEYLVELQIVSKKEVTGKILKIMKPATELSFQLNLFHGLLKNKAEAILLQKGAELGVTNFYPFVSARSINKKLGKSHLEKITQEAVEVVGRMTLPIVHEIQNFPDVFESIGSKNSLNLLAFEEANQSLSLGEVLKKLTTSNQQHFSSINLFIGPEGGFEKDEVEMAKKSGVLIVSLGNRVLRAETAGIFFISSILYKFHFDRS